MAHKTKFIDPDSWYSKFEDLGDTLCQCQVRGLRIYFSPREKRTGKGENKIKKNNFVTHGSRVSDVWKREERWTYT